MGKLRAYLIGLIAIIIIGSPALVVAQMQPNFLLPFSKPVLFVNKAKVRMAIIQAVELPTSHFSVHGLTIPNSAPIIFSISRAEWIVYPLVAPVVEVFYDMFQTTFPLVQRDERKVYSTTCEAFIERGEDELLDLSLSSCILKDPSGRLVPRYDFGVSRADRLGFGADVFAEIVFSEK